MADQLSVVVNPYSAVDHLGRPSGAVLKDPVEHRPYRDDPKNKDVSKRWEKREFVGAQRQSKQLAAGRTVKVGSAKKTFPGKFDHSFEFAKEVQTVPNTKYYQRALKNGELFAADAKSRALAGGDPALYQAPEVKLAHAKEGAIAQFVALYGPDDERLATLKSHWS